MIDENEETYQYYPSKPDIERSQDPDWGKSIMSLLLFIAVFYFLVGDFRVLLLVVLILFLHEMGHFIAMKVFKYNEVNMFFIPLVGALTTGQKTEVSLKQRSIILLAGPVPGILIGIGLILYGNSIVHNHVITAGLFFVFVNLFNLLPLDPLDGGKLIETLFFSTNQQVKKVFLVVSVFFMVFIGIAYEMYVLALVGAFMFSRLKTINLLEKIRKQASEMNFSLKKTYDELTDEEYWQIRKIYLSESNLSKMIDPNDFSNSQIEFKLAETIEGILIPPTKKDISILGKIVFLLVWFGTIALSVWFTLPFIEAIILQS